MTRLYDEVRTGIDTPPPADKNRLKTDLCGIPLENPFLLSSSVVASTYDMCARAFEAGWAGAAFKTICTLDIHEASPRFSAVTGNSGEIIGFKNIEQLSDHSVAENMEIFRRLKQNYPDKFILASIMGMRTERCRCGRTYFSCPNMAEGGLGSDIGQIPDLVEQLTRSAKSGCHIPVLAKLTPNVASMIPAGEAAVRGGADGIAAINTIKSITGVNPHTLVTAPAVRGKSALGGYSGNAVKPIALRFIAELAKDPDLSGIHISGMGGIETWRDALDTLSESTDTLERDTILFPKFNHAKCIGCGRCYISCRDGGHSAIKWCDDRKPVLDGSKCVGCHLCRLVCPERAIGIVKKRIDFIK